MCIRDRATAHWPTASNNVLAIYTASMCVCVCVLQYSHVANLQNQLPMSCQLTVLLTLTTELVGVSIKWVFPHKLVQGCRLMLYCVTIANGHKYIQGTSYCSIVESAPLLDEDEDTNTYRAPERKRFHSLVSSSQYLCLFPLYHQTRRNCPQSR